MSQPTLYLGPQIRIFNDVVDTRQAQINASLSKLFVATPALDYEATNKLYVDTAIGVETLRAETAEAAMQMEMMAETERATAAENVLRDQIFILGTRLETLYLYFFGNASPVLPSNQPPIYPPSELGMGRDQPLMNP